MVAVSEIDTFIVDIPTIRPHVLAMATMRHQSIVLVRMRDADGVEGVGEGTTIGGLSYGEESPEGIKLAIDSYIAPILKTCDAARVGAAMASVSRSVYGNHIAKSAVGACATGCKSPGRWQAGRRRATSTRPSAC